MAPTTTPIEIAPTAHYSMGGVWVRPDDHATDVIWSGPARLEREAIPPIPPEIAALMNDVSTAGRLLE